MHVLAEVTGVEYAASHMLSDGVRAVRFPTYSPVSAPELPAQAAMRPKQQRPRLDCSLWPVIAERARHESLRDLAAEYGVSHETIRAVVRRAAGALCDAEVAG